jgi:methionyl aminopeptidase
MTIRNPIDWEGLRRSGALVAETIALLKEKARPGMTTEELDWEAEEHLRRHGARSAPALCYKFPGTTCISVNNEAAHGVPSSRVLKEGDLVNVDVSLELGGYFADSGASFGLGPISAQQKKLLEAAQRALDAGLEAVTAGAPIRAIADIYAEVADSRGFGLIRDLTGHGVGGWIHEEPKHVPDFGRRKDNRVFKEGQVLTLEPFLTTGPEKTLLAEDGWTLYIPKGHYSAQFEHSLVVTQGKPVLLTVL